MNDDVILYGMLILSALAAGAVNAMAGGGTLLTFPALLAVPGLTSIQANATSTVALLPGSLASAFGYRTELAETKRLLSWLIWPSLIGGTVGALLVTAFPQKVFDGLVPWLILGAAVIFMLQAPLKRWISGVHPTQPTSKTLVLIVFAQLLVAIYGGYFGAGIGILMLSVLPFMGTGSIHETNAAKTVLASVINFVTVLVFIVQGQIIWHYAAIMAVSAVIGGYLGARISRKIPASTVRLLVILLGFTLGIYYLWKQYGSAAPN